MAIYLLVFFISFLVNLVLLIPFINLLYKLKFQRASQETRDAFNKRTPIFDKFHKQKAGTPVGGGILIILTTLFGFTLFIFSFAFMGKDIVSNYQSITSEIKILLFTFLFFSFLGVYDLSWWYIPFATFVIVAFSNAVNISDGLDGLSSGVLLIALLAFWTISISILDTPLLIFIAVWIGGLIAFLYFNVYPARLFLGDTGALSFGATFAVIGLLLGKVFALTIIGGVFVAEILSSLIQLVSKKYRGKKLFPVAPIHLWLQYKGWEEPKIVMRAWVISILFAVFGLMIAFLK